MKLTLYMTKGLSGSGKSTKAREMVRQNPGKLERVNKDDLRAMLHGGKWSKGNEKQIVAARDALIGAALASGRSVISDDTNLAPAHEARLREIADEFMVNFEIIDLTDVPIDECIKRDLLRDASVGEAVIRKQFNDFLRPDIEAALRVELNPELPDCIIVDIDGTLALHTHRGPYQYELCGTDDLNEQVARVVGMYRDEGMGVVICSGREAKTMPDSPVDIYDETELWLEKNDVDWDELLMRAEGDMRKDSIVKREFLEQIITRWNPVLVIDDRDQVVSMWREAGLECWQVAPGAF
jgi:predicted kinase